MSQYIKYTTTKKMTKIFRVRPGDSLNIMDADKVIINKMTESTDAGTFVLFSDEKSQVVMKVTGEDEGHSLYLFVKKTPIPTPNYTAQSFLRKLHPSVEMKATGIVYIYETTKSHDIVDLSDESIAKLKEFWPDEDESLYESLYVAECDADDV